MELKEIILELSWTYTRADGRVAELSTTVPGPVSLDNLGEYLSLLVEAKLTECFETVESVRNGLLSVIPENAVTLLCWDELQQVVCGSRTIDVSRLRENTEYDDDVSADDVHIKLFWSALESFSESEKSAFLKFVWARPTLPPVSVPFPQKMKIQSAVGDDAAGKPDVYLPKAHTCFFSLNLPKYTTKQVGLMQFN